MPYYTPTPPGLHALRVAHSSLALTMRRVSSSWRRAEPSSSWAPAGRRGWGGGGVRAVLSADMTPCKCKGEAVTTQSWCRASVRCSGGVKRLRGRSWPPFRFPRPRPAPKNAHAPEALVPGPRQGTLGTTTAAGGVGRTTTGLQLQVSARRGGPAVLLRHLCSAAGGGGGLRLRLQLLPRLGALLLRVAVGVGVGVGGERGGGRGDEAGGGRGLWGRVWPHSSCKGRRGRGWGWGGVRGWWGGTRAVGALVLCVS